MKNSILTELAASHEKTPLWPRKTSKQFLRRHFCPIKPYALGAREQDMSSHLKKHISGKFCSGVHKYSYQLYHLQRLVCGRFTVKTKDFYNVVVTQRIRRISFTTRAFFSFCILNILKCLHINIGSRNLLLILESVLYSCQSNQRYLWI